MFIRDLERGFVEYLDTAPGCPTEDHIYEELFRIESFRNRGFRGDTQDQSQEQLVENRIDKFKDEDTFYPKPKGKAKQKNRDEFFRVVKKQLRSEYSIENCQLYVRSISELLCFHPSELKSNQITKLFGVHEKIKQLFSYYVSQSLELKDLSVFASSDKHIDLKILDQVHGEAIVNANRGLPDLDNNKPKIDLYDAHNYYFQVKSKRDHHAAIIFDFPGQKELFLIWGKSLIADYDGFILYPNKAGGQPIEATYDEGECRLFAFSMGKTPIVPKGMCIPEEQAADPIKEADLKELVAINYIYSKETFDIVEIKANLHKHKNG